MFFSDSISGQFYDYIKTSPLTCKANQWKGLYNKFKSRLTWFDKFDMG